jgi:hypothetical protein
MREWGFDGGLDLAQPANGDARDAAQAVELVHALREQLHEEAAALRRDILEVQFLIDRLERRYLNGDEHPTHPSARH